MFFAFRGGVHPADRKSSTRNKPVEIMAAPAYVALPMNMHIGSPSEPVCRTGQTVLMGEKIAEATGPSGVPVHSSVSGKVAAIEPYPHPNGAKALTVIVENDGKDTLHPDIRPYGSVESLTPEELYIIIRETGIVGLGGAAFPTHAKIKFSQGKVKLLIINGCECEPYITSDHRLMLETPEDVIGGTRALMKVLGVERAVIAVESNKRNAYESLRRMLPRVRRDISVKMLPTRYPQGAEKQLVKAVTGREVPPGAFPSALGAAVFNVATAAYVHRAVTMGMPLISRVVTVSGSAVSNPKNLLTRVGVPLEEVFAQTGGFREEPSKVIVGGPMMGIAQHSLKAPILKSTDSLLAFSRREDIISENPVCIRCGKCVSVCPMNLMPESLYRYALKDDLDRLEKLNLLDCLECGCCSYNCPGRLFLVQSFRSGKQKLRGRPKKEAAQ